MIPVKPYIKRHHPMGLPEPGVDPVPIAEAVAALFTGTTEAE
jgi:hypothetical protein